MPDATPVDHGSPHLSDSSPGTGASRYGSNASWHSLWKALTRRRGLALGVAGGLLLLCALYCLFWPREYEAVARVALRTEPASPLTLNAQPTMPASILASAVQTETLADELRSDDLAWRVIRGLKLYAAPGFRGSFARRFPEFRPEAPSAAAQAWLLERFARRLHVQTTPHTLLVEVRFRTREGALSAAVVNALIAAYDAQTQEAEMQATAQASAWLNGQLAALKARVAQDDAKLAEFEDQHGIVSAPGTLANGQPGAAEHMPALEELDGLSRDLVEATTERIVREAEYRAAVQGDPELVAATDARPQAAGSAYNTALLQQLRARRSDLEQEQAQLSIEHGPNFPRVVEIGQQLQDLERQRKAEEARLLERLRAAWQTALTRETLVRKSLDAQTGVGQRLNQATAQYEAMRQEAAASHALYVQVLAKTEEAGLAAGVHGSEIEVVDKAREPVKPVTPDPLVDLAITLFAGLWLAVVVVLVAEALQPEGKRAAVALLMALGVCGLSRAQAPTPSTSGLPTGVARIPQSQETRSTPNAKEAPAVWGSPAGAAGAARSGVAAEAEAPAMLAPGDLVAVSEYHTPEFRAQVRVAKDGTVMLPMIGDVRVAGLDEQGAARAIEAALKAKGMLLHPAVTVLATVTAGQDVSVLGEVARPGVYPYLEHHRLRDVIAEASGLSPTAGSLAVIFHRDSPETPHAVALHVGGEEAGGEHNPELSPGDTVQVSRAGLVFVVGDVIRPGGFAIDPQQGLTLAQAVSLAWGPTQNAALNKAVLIREQKGGRTVTRIDLKRLLRGQDPDMAVEDRDIVFVPDSTAKNLWNRSIESTIQSAVGVTIYSGLVYSQRY